MNSKLSVLQKCEADLLATVERQTLLDEQVAASVKQLIARLVARQQVWFRARRITQTSTAGLLSALELRELAAARSASTSEYSLQQFYRLWFEELRDAPEEIRYAVIPLFKVADSQLLPPENYNPLLELLRQMIAEEQP